MVVLVEFGRWDEFVLLVLVFDILSKMVSYGSTRKSWEKGLSRKCILSQFATAIPIVFLRIKVV